MVDQWPLELLQEHEVQKKILTSDEASQQCPLFMEQQLHACCWTQSWSCPDQPKGQKGLAMNDGTLSYHCCCTEGFWKKTKQCPNFDELATQEEARQAASRKKSAVDCNTTHLEDVDPPVRLATVMPKACKIPVEIYRTSPVVQKQCKEKKRWERLAKKVKPLPCVVDPTTKMMTCRRNNTCHGGANVVQNYAFLTKTLTYDCGSSCTGSLLVNCCNTCREAQRNPEEVGVDMIECKGCGKTTLQNAAQEAHCQMFNGAFKCHTQAMCTVGEPSEECHTAQDACDLYPCNNCDAPHLKAKCCAQCLGLMCTSRPKRRMICSGCEGPPKNSEVWWHFWKHMS